jgi:hypothetical protein
MIGGLVVWSVRSVMIAIAFYITPNEDTSESVNQTMTLPFWNGVPQYRASELYSSHASFDREEAAMHTQVFMVFSS